MFIGVIYFIGTLDEMKVVFAAKFKTGTHTRDVGRFYRLRLKRQKRIIKFTALYKLVVASTGLFICLGWHVVCTGGLLSSKIKISYLSVFHVMWNSV